MNAEKRRIGFTLLELIVVVMIVGFLAAISIPNFRKARMQAPRRSLGFAVGGAMDALSFRENINKGYLPLASGK